MKGVAKPAYDPKRTLKSHFRIAKLCAGAQDQRSKLRRCAHQPRALCGEAESSGRLVRVDAKFILPITIAAEDAKAVWHVPELKAINVTLQTIDVRRADELDEAFDRARLHVEAFIVVDDGLFVAHRRRIAELAIKSRLPGVGFWEFCEAGGLAAYGVDFPDIWRSAGTFVDKILKGAKPADLPIEQATQFEFAINLQSAKAIGFDVSPTMSARANQIIE